VTEDGSWPNALTRSLEVLTRSADQANRLRATVSAYAEPMSTGEDRLAAAFEKALKPPWAIYRNVAWLEKRPVIDGDDLARIGQRVEEIFDWWSASGDASADGGAPGAKGMAALHELLARDLEIASPLAAGVASDEARIVTLSESQFAALDMLAVQRRAVILGVAGSGKTLLAAEKARRLAAQGFEVLLTCFNRPLAEYLAATVGRLDRVTVSIADLRGYTDFVESHGAAAAASLLTPGAPAATLSSPPRRPGSSSTSMARCTSASDSQIRNRCAVVSAAQRPPSQAGLWAGPGHRRGARQQCPSDISLLI
jgi:hypothetical protein